MKKIINKSFVLPVLVVALGSVLAGQVAASAAPPQLMITPSGANVLLSWPASATGFHLESTTNLNPTVVWTSNSTPPVLVNGKFTVTNPIADAERFYRLSALGQNLTVTNGLALWLAADSGIATNSGGLVSAWSDQSGEGHSGSQASSGGQPAFLPNQLNGLPVVHFSGGQFFSLAGQVLTSQTFTVFAMTRDQRTDTNFRELISNWDNTTGNQLTSMFLGTTALNPVRVRFTDNFGGADQGQTGVGIVSNPTNFFILTAVSGATTVALYQNTTNIAFNASPLTPRNLGGGYVVGRQGTGTFDEYWHGDIAELIVFNRELTATELNQVWQYLAAKYGAAFAR
jgi:hypothetical protein